MYYLILHSNCVLPDQKFVSDFNQFNHRFRRVAVTQKSLLRHVFIIVITIMSTLDHRSVILMYVSGAFLFFPSRTSDDCVPLNFQNVSFLSKCFSVDNEWGLSFLEFLVKGNYRTCAEENQEINYTHSM